MSFNEMKVGELRELADAYAVDVNKTDNKEVVVRKMTESGVTWEYHVAQVAAAEAPGVERVSTTPKPVFDEPADGDDNDPILLRMTRANGTFQIRGATFTQNNPYAIVNERDADFIIENYDGFRIASPREVREFYS
jgi:hypothetical protein